MNSSTVLEIVALLVGGGGGGVAITRLTRLVIAVEGLVESFKDLNSTVQGHETRISAIEGQRRP